ncbi:MAG TPA: signal peptidase I [Acidimicrobiales bacterium]
MSEEPPFDAEDLVRSEVVSTNRHVVTHSRTRLVIEWLSLLVVAVVISLLLRSYGFQTFYIPSASMVPTLQIGDRLIVNKLSVELGTVNRGDIVVFRAPPSENCGVKVTDLVKRVIGLPGDHLSSKGNTIYVNGAPLNEKWPHTEPLGTPIGNVTVGPDHYFMMGDNHFFSCDSRSWGTVPRSDIIGKAFVRIWPLSRVGSL